MAVLFQQLLSKTTLSVASFTLNVQALMAAVLLKIFWRCKVLIPAIDLINGEVVRLYQGDYAAKNKLSNDSCRTTKLYTLNAGAQVMHFVDLDGAKDSTKRQLTLVIKHVSKSSNDDHTSRWWRSQ